MRKHSVQQKALLSNLWKGRCASGLARRFRIRGGTAGHSESAPEDPTTLIVKLQPESEATRYGVRSVCGGIGFESGAIIFVRRFDATWLGIIMAHGHIVLGPNAHSIVGIMRVTFRNEEWEKAAHSTLGFTRHQDQQIRTWIDDPDRR
jgi:hypothetical protein